MTGPRPFGAAGLLRAAQQWVSTQYPYFNRSGGRDHIWQMSHDEGACYAPVEIWPGVILIHWGRTDMPHISNSLVGGVGCGGGLAGGGGGARLTR